MMRAWFATFLITCVATAQDVKRTTATVLVPISAVTGIKPRSYEVQIGRGRADGVVLGWRGRAVSIRKDKDKSGVYLGEAEIIAVDDRVARARITRVDPPASTPLQTGDGIHLRMRIVQRPNRSLLWKLALENVTLTEARERKLLSDFRTLHEHETPALANKILDKMVQTIRALGQEMRDMEALKTPIQHGRYKGRTTADVMQKTSRQDLEDFLRFILNYPERYRGRTWSIEETFASWALNNAPYGYLEIRARLLSAATDDERGKIYDQYDPDAKLRRELCESLLSYADDLTNRGEFDSAGHSFGIGRSIAGFANEPALFARVDISQAIFHSKKGNRKKSIAEYESADEKLRPLETKNAATKALHQRVLSALGTEYRKAGQFADAQRVLRESIELASSDRERAAALIKLGAVFTDNAKPVEALAELGKAEDICRASGAVDLLVGVLRNSAKELIRLGRAKDAAERFEEAQKQCARMGDRETEAETWSDIGFMRWAQDRYDGATAAFKAAADIYRELNDQYHVGSMLQGIGKLKIAEEKFDEARDYFQQALEAFSGRENKTFVLVDLAEVDTLEEHVEQATNKLNQALAAFVDLNNRWGQGYVLMLLGDLDKDQFRFERSREKLTKAAELFRLADTPSTQRVALQKLAKLNFRLKDYKATQANYQDALRACRATGERANEIDVLLDQAHLFLLRLDFAGAEKSTAAALTISIAIGNPLLEARCHRQRGRVESKQNRHEIALVEYTKALEKFTDPWFIAETQLRMADTLGSQGQFDKKRARLDRALLAAQDAELPDLEIRALLTIGDTLATTGDPDGALQYFQRAAEIETRSAFTRADRALKLAVLYNELGRGAEAIRLAKQAHGAFGELRNYWGQTNASVTLADLYASNGDVDNALIAIQAALPRAKSTGFETSIHRTYGEILLEQGDAKQALQHLEIAQRVAKERGAEWSQAEAELRLARAYRELGKYPESARATKSALTYFERTGARMRVADALEEQAKLALAAGNPAEAKTAMVRAVRIAVDSRSPRLLARANHQLSLAQQALGETMEAVASRRAAIAALERLRTGVGADARAERVFLRSRIEIYESMAELLAEAIEKETDDAKKQELIRASLGFIARARFQILSRDSEQTQLTGVKAVDDLLAEIRRVKADIARMERTREKAQLEGNTKLAKKLTRLIADNIAKLDRHHTNLRVRNKDFAVGVKFHPSSLSMKLKSLPEGARFVLYFPGVKSLYIWVYDKNGIVSWKSHAVSRDALTAKIARFSSLIDEAVIHTKGAKGRGFGPVAEANENNPDWYRENCRKMRIVLRELHGVLIEPIENEVQDAKPLLVMPYGWLNYLPFEALLDRENKFFGEGRTLAYLLHHDHLDSVLRQLLTPPRRPEKDVWVAFADPVGKLGSALEEAESIRQLYPNHSVHTEETKTASEQQLFENLREDCTILHFATHGFLKGSTPSNTFLELASGGSYDGKLLQEEIFPQLSYKLKCLQNGKLRLVVLSACDSAKAASDPAAEILGMPDKFTLSGTPAVVASLWSVYTYSTSALMEGFYTHLSKGKPVGESLQLARDELLKDQANGRYAHPFYWSPFLLFGDWR